MQGFTNGLVGSRVGRPVLETRDLNLLDCFTRSAKPGLEVLKFISVN